MELLTDDEENARTERPVCFVHVLGDSVSLATMLCVRSTEYRGKKRKTWRHYQPLESQGPSGALQQADVTLENDGDGFFYLRLSTFFLSFLFFSWLSCGLYPIFAIAATEKTGAIVDVPARTIHFYT